MHVSRTRMLSLLLLPIGLAGAYLDHTLLPAYYLEHLLETTLDQPAMRQSMHASSRPLFTAFPSLSKKVAHIELAQLPTPLFHADKLGAALNTPKLYIKDDGMTGKQTTNGLLFGGNKVRKLEFLLADAQRCNAQSVITFGCAGSNHAVATSIYAQEVGLDCHCMLKPQPASGVVARNLLLHSTTNTRLHYFPDDQSRLAGTQALCLQEKETHHSYPYIIPTGGSNPIGTFGFINAAFELKEQIDAGIMPMPDYLFVPIGSGGTIVGLSIGCALANLPIEVIAIGVEPEEYDGMYRGIIHKLFNETMQALKKLGADLPAIKWDEPTIITNCGGDGYGMQSPDAERAIELFKETENLALDSVYSGKAAAGMRNYINEHSLHEQVILFWNTFCSKVDEQLQRTNKERLPGWTKDYIG